jgi:hypothetical protein
MCLCIISSLCNLLLLSKIDSDAALFEVVEEREPTQNRNILKDQTIRLTGVGTQVKCPHLLRRIEAAREDTGDILVF